MLKVMFINPPMKHTVKGFAFTEIAQKLWVMPSLGIMYVVAVLERELRGKVEVIYIDCLIEEISYSGLVSMVQSYKPDICAITANSMTIIDVVLTCKLIKNISNSILTVVGGHHVDSYPEETLSNEYIDYICQGEADETFTDLVISIMSKKEPFEVPGIGFKKEGSVYINRNIPEVKELDLLPFPLKSIKNLSRKYLFSPGKTVMSISSSRGCPYRCRFCYFVNRNYRSRSAVSIAEEIKMLKMVGVDEIYFTDDIFNITPKRVIDISNAIIDSGIKIEWSFRGRVDNVTEEMLKTAKKAGCIRIHYGIETYSEKTLKILNKDITVETVKEAVSKTRCNGIEASGYFMIGLPGETIKDVYNTYDYMMSLGLDYAHIENFIPLPNTELYKEGVKKGILKEDFWKELSLDPLSYINGFEPQFWTENITINELKRLVVIGNRKFYFRLDYLFSRFKAIKSIRELFARAYQFLLFVMEFYNNDIGKEKI